MNKNTWKIVIRPMGALAAAAILMASVPSWGLAQVQAAAQAQAEPGVRRRFGRGRNRGIRRQHRRGRRYPGQAGSLKGWIFPRGPMSISPQRSWTRPWRSLNWP